MLTTTNLLVISASSLLALLVIAAVFAWSLKSWLDLKRSELGGGPESAQHGARQVGNRIELADLRERVRKLEAIAAGVDI